jgi:hypothetical protein
MPAAILLVAVVVLVLDFTVLSWSPRKPWRFLSDAG